MSWLLANIWMIWLKGSFAHSWFPMRLSCKVSSDDDDHDAEDNDIEECSSRFSAICLLHCTHTVMAT